MLFKSTPPSIHHLFSIKSLSTDNITYFLDRAEYFLNTAIAKQAVLTTLCGKVIINLFFEASTRTRNSFEIAAHRLGAIVLSPNMQHSSTSKGELLVDTMHNLEAMGASLLVIRHSTDNLAEFLASESQSNISIINAGDGSNEHPTQTLIDLLTIRQHCKNFSDLTVVIVGDVLHSRVARSLIFGLHIMGVKKVRIISPEAFTPVDTEVLNVDVYHSLDAGLKDADVIYTLRIQKERMTPEQKPKDEHYFKHFGLTTEKLKLAKSDAIVMHPGPINRGIEIQSSVADGPQSVILQQTKNSVAIRMAVIETILS